MFKGLGEGSQHKWTECSEIEEWPVFPRLHGFPARDQLPAGPAGAVPELASTAMSRRSSARTDISLRGLHAGGSTR